MEFTEINLEFPFYAARNPEHYILNYKILKIITPELAELLGITAYRNDYKNKFDIENSCYINAQGYQATKDIVALDDKRKKIFLYISQIVTAACNSPEEEMAQVGERMAFLLKPYKYTYNYSYAKASALILDFCDKMQNSEYEADLEYLNLTKFITMLQEANDEFDAIYDERSKLELRNAKAESMKTIRPKVDSAFLVVAKFINAAYLTNEVKGKSDELGQKLKTVIESINSLLHRLQSTLSREGVIGKNTKSENEVTATPEETVKPIIKEVYQIEGGDPEKPNEITRNHDTAIDGIGIKLLNSSGDAPGDIILTPVNAGLDEKVKPEAIKKNTDTRIEFTMVPDLAEGEYKIRIETYYNGEENPPLETPVIIEYPQTIRLI